MLFQLLTPIDIHQREFIGGVEIKSRLIRRNVLVPLPCSILRQALLEVTYGL
jgi:hypothetical protein